MDIKIALLFLCLRPLYCDSGNVELLSENVDGTKQVKIKHVGDTLHGKEVHIKEVHGKEVHGKEVHVNEVHKGKLKQQTENSAKKIIVHVKVQSNKTTAVTPKKMSEDIGIAKPAFEIGESQSIKDKREIIKDSGTKKTSGKRPMGVQLENKHMIQHVMGFLNRLKHQIGKTLQNPKPSGQRRYFDSKKTQHPVKHLYKPAPTRKVLQIENAKNIRMVWLEEKHVTKRAKDGRKTTPTAG